MSYTLECNCEMRTPLSRPSSVKRMDDIDTQTLDIKDNEKKKPLSTVEDEDGSLLYIYDDSITFHPPVYQQRYLKVKDIIQKAFLGTALKLLDLGSSECGLFRYLRGMTELQEIILLDKDIQVLQDNLHRLRPLPVDYLIKRSTPLTVTVLGGDARKVHPAMTNVQVVTMIELIEHMEVEELFALTENVFHKLQPKLVVVSTPNANFNAYIPGFTPYKFRHWDHKFEWTSEQFQQWCHRITSEKGSNYSVSFCGCGLGPNKTYCTQIAVFLRESHNEEETMCDNFNSLKLDACSPSQSALHFNSEFKASLDLAEGRHITVLAVIEYPSDTRTSEERNQSHTLERFNSLLQYISAAEENTVDSVNHSGMSEGSSEECRYGCWADFHVVHVNDEEEICNVIHRESDDHFYVVNNTYAIIPINALSAWICTTAHNSISTNMIRETLKDQFFETVGAGNEWMGKVLLTEVDEVDGNTTDETEEEKDEEEAEGILFKFERQNDVPFIEGEKSNASEEAYGAATYSVEATEDWLLEDRLPDGIHLQVAYNSTSTYVEDWDLN